MPYKVLNVEGLIALMKDIQGDRTQQEFAESLNVSPQYLSDVYNNRRDPGPSILSCLSASMAYVIPEEKIDEIQKQTRRVERRHNKKQGSG